MIILESKLFSHAGNPILVWTRWVAALPEYESCPELTLKAVQECKRKEVAPTFYNILLNLGATFLGLYTLFKIWHLSRFIFLGFADKGPCLKKVKKMYEGEICFQFDLLKTKVYCFQQQQHQQI